MNMINCYLPYRLAAASRAAYARCSPVVFSARVLPSFRPSACAPLFLPWWSYFLVTLTRRGFHHANRVSHHVGGSFLALWLYPHNSLPCMLTAKHIGGVGRTRHARQGRQISN